MLLDSWFFAKELLNLIASLSDVGSLFMLCIGNLLLLMIIKLAEKSKIIPKSFMALVPIMISKAGLSQVSPYSTNYYCYI